MGEYFDEDDEDEISITCIGDNVGLVTLKVAIELEGQLLAALPAGAVLYLIEKRDDGFCRVTNAPNAEPFLVPTEKLRFEPSRSH